MKPKKSYRARKSEIQAKMKAGMLDLAVALARVGRCNPSDMLPAYGVEPSSSKTKKHYSPDELVNTKEAGVILGLSPKTLENWRCQGKGPQFLNLGKRCHYRVRDLEAYLAANKFGSTSEYGGRR